MSDPESYSEKRRKIRRGPRGPSPSEFRLPPLPINTPMAHHVIGAISTMNSAGRVRESLSLAYWPRVVGPIAASATIAESVRDGVLIVHTRSSVWSHELNMYKARILEGLNRMLGGQVLRDIRFRAVGVKHEDEELRTEAPNTRALESVQLDPEEESELAEQVARLASISNERARSAIEKRITLDTKLRHWRLERGWRPCARCGQLHNADTNLCEVCGAGH